MSIPSINKHFYLIYPLLIIIIIFLVILIFPKKESNDNSTSNLDDSKSVVIPYELEYINISNCDSIKILYDELQVESLITYTQEIVAKNTWLEEQYNNIVSDIRQENNNLIDKVNLWLTFWIAVLSIISIILPIIVQYQVYREFEKNILKKVRDLRLKMENYQKDHQSIINKHQSERILREGINLLMVGIDSSLVEPPNLKNNAYFKHLWFSVYEQLRIISNEYFNNKKNVDINCDYQLTDLLLYMYDYMNQLQRVVPVYKSRDFNLVQDSIRKTFLKIINNEYPSYESLKKEYNDLIELFRQLLSGISM